ncbi:prostaglandin E synthase [Rhincodon typus]|uniref:prostaglandin E synthase n=1 Tax=Rhincodon typus TaxID=259920 RepID=UPI0009A35A8B|nr:prostaglandin E synthase [Rhincodon typus]
MDNPVFTCYIFYSTLLVLKLYTLAIITGQLRLHKKAFINPEDAVRHGGQEYHRTDPDVERSRRAHRNARENIFPFLFLGAIYSLMEPNLFIAHVHFLVFFVARVVHSVAYLFAFRAPTRSLAYIIAQVPCVSIAVQILSHIAIGW